MSKILLVGATGYVGGTVLSQLLASTEFSLRNLTFDILVRREYQAELLRSVYQDRINIVYWDGLDNIQSVKTIASRYDIIVNASSGFKPAGAKAFVDGLATRDRANSPIPWLLHTSGCTNLVNLDLSPQPFEWNDGRDGRAVFDHLKFLDAVQPYPQRTAEITVLETAAKRDVQAVSLQAPCIFGEGTGLFNRQGVVIPSVIRYVVHHGHGFKLNDTANFDWVHVVDLADYYVLLVRTILERSDRGVGYVPSGKEGVLFPTTGRALLTDINRNALDAAFHAGLLPREDTPPEKEIHLASLEDLSEELTAGYWEVAKMGWGGEKAVKGTIGQSRLGWKPKRQQEAWEQDFHDELTAFKDGHRSITISSCIGAP
ncbi:hypothetical protein E8E13_008904 [Curvularia kusanoi]|uniref:NAD-dependent epimerase/dehydratase domain-containing protein n=1 Tax=Curvularia kusanoi TaxID=90978 RepID=A0A9P4WCG0_CURKU|nr:hypothetical protein E8E13_008904 [Curvularia kusanoi]